jgi:iron complex outermembrane receptor protein
LPGHAARRWAATCIVAAALAIGSPAWAAPILSFDIPRKTLGAQLVDLATTAGVSISTRAAARCAPFGQATVGRFSLEGALDHLLAGSGCGWRMRGPNAVEIVVLPAAAPREAPRAAAPAVPVPPLDELIVVATRRPTRADRLAYAVSSEDGPALAAMGVHDDGDLAATTPSMTVTNLGPGRDKILVRGLSDGPLTGRTQSMVGIYLDEVRLTFNAPDPDLRLVDMSQVEILRGPQGALYGAGSLGGLLHLITAPPDRTALRGWISGTLGATRGGGGSNVIEGALNLPVLEGRGAARAVAWRDEAGGYIDDSRLGLKDVNRSIRQGLRVSSVLDLTPQWTVSAGFVTQAINSADTQYAFAGQPAFTRDIAVQEPHDNDFAEGHLGLQGTLPWADFKWTTAVVSHHLSSRYDATSAPPVAIAPGPAAFDDDNSIRAFVSEAVLTSRPGDSIRWLAGLFVGDSRQDSDLRLLRLTPVSAAAFTETRRDELDEAAVFGEAAAPLGGRFTLTLGGRLFRSQVVTDSTILAAAGGARSTFSGKQSHAGFSPKIMLAYAPRAAWLAYVEASQGYRSGGFNTTGAPGQAFSPTGGTAPSRLYAGDELWNLEAGVRLSALDDRLTLRAAAFQTIWKNIQSDELLPSGFPFTANIGGGRNAGIEFEGRYASGPMILRTELLLNDPELHHANPVFPVRSEFGLAGVPRISAGVAAHYAWPLPAGRAFALDGRLGYVGRSRLTFDNLTSPAMGGYATSRMAAALEAAPWTLIFAIENLTDARGNTFAYGNPFTLRTTEQVTPLRPRTASITLRVAY